MLSYGILTPQPAWIAFSVALGFVGFAVLTATLILVFAKRERLPYAKGIAGLYAIGFGAAALVEFVGAFSTTPALSQIESWVLFGAISVVTIATMANVAAILEREKREHEKYDYNVTHRYAA